MPDPLNRPVQTRPTPVKSDTLFYTQVDGPTVDAVRLDYGTDYEDTANFPDFKLCREDREGLALAKRWWACEFTLQDTYNYSTDYGEENPAYPRLSRRYVILRSKYAPRTVLSPLLGIGQWSISNGGMDYTPANPPDVVLTGGTGSGGQLRAVVNQSGAVCALVIIDPGNYSVAPSVSFVGGDGSGAAATVSVQLQTALLISQRLVEFPDDDPRKSIFVMHECIYETLPGPVVRYDEGYEEETGAFWARYRQRVQATASVPAQKDEYPAASGTYVIDAGIHLETDQSNAGTLVVYVMENPASRTESNPGNYTAPNLFTPLGIYAQWPIPSSFPGCPIGPYQNRADGLNDVGQPLNVYTGSDADHYGTYENQVPIPCGPLGELISYFIPGGPFDPGVLPAIFSSSSQESRFLPVNRNTIHGPLTIVYTDTASGNQVVIENLRASSGDAYAPLGNHTHVINGYQKQWKGPFYKRVVTICEFPVLPNE